MVQIPYSPAIELFKKKIKKKKEEVKGDLVYFTQLVFYLDIYT